MDASTTHNGDSLHYKPFEYGWKAIVPEEIGTFFELPLTVEISTRHIPTAPATLPMIHDSQQRLVSSIIERLGKILLDAENGLDDWGQGDDLNSKITHMTEDS